MIPEITVKCGILQKIRREILHFL